MNGVTCFIGVGVNGIVFPGVGVALGGVACVFVVLVAVVVVLVLLVLFVLVFFVLLVFDDDDLFDVVVNIAEIVRRLKVLKTLTE